MDILLLIHNPRQFTRDLKKFIGDPQQFNTCALLRVSRVALISTFLFHRFSFDSRDGIRLKNQGRLVVYLLDNLSLTNTSLKAHLKPYSGARVAP